MPLSSEQTLPMPLCPETTIGGGTEDAAADPVVAASELLVLPVALCGIAGNVLNLVVLTDRAMRRSLGPREGSANCGLVALATSDLLFCVSALPFAFAPRLSASLVGPAHLYGRLNAAVISGFIMASTLLTVVMATERYAAVCHPLLARRRLSLGRTKALVAAVFVFSALFNLPLLWGSKSVACWWQPGSNGTRSQMYFVERVTIVDRRVDTAYRVMWAVVGNFLPLAVLLYCNVRLLVSIKRALGRRRQMTGSQRTSRNGLRPTLHRPACDAASGNQSTTLTITLVCIVVMFMVLVAPSETLKLYSLLTSHHERAVNSSVSAAPVSLEGNRRYRQIEAVTNCMQSLSFCLNFVLYCLALKSFRRALMRIACRRLDRRRLAGTELLRLATLGPPDRRTRRQPIRNEREEELLTRLDCNAALRQPIKDEQAN